jgi:arginyl-tRNA synthetase|tara:strand:+ start:1618 stop:3387 length:1770 start_codon:yes stop_codon:yes gene_type:complete
VIWIRDLIFEISPAFSKAMESLEVDDSVWLPLIGKATVEDHGDLALPCHSLASRLRKSPIDIAEQICTLVRDDLDSIANVSAISGFVNISAKPAWLSKSLSRLLSDPRLGVELDNPLTFAVDYSAPNVAKEMHVGHLRSTVIGDSIVRMLEFKGHRAIRENHVGDWGTPFGMLIEHLLDLGEDMAATELGVGDLDSFYKQARGKFVSDDEFANRSRSRVVLLQGGDSETLRLWGILVDESMRYFNEVYSMLGVLLTDEDIRGESSYQDLLPEVVERLNEVGILEESEGADVVFPGGWVNREGDPLPMIIRKADGGYNYSTSDLACIIDRVERIGCDGFLYVVGTPQKQHFEMVFQVAIKAGFMNENHQAIHVNFGSVLDIDGKVLKSREGEVIKLHDLLDEAIRRAEHAINEKNPDLVGDERKEVARTVGIGAVKYADLSTERTKDYVFDWERMLSFEGNTAPYLQYAYARICSIFRKWEGERESLREDSESLLEDELSMLSNEELTLSRRLVEFTSILDETISTFSPHKLCKHLHSVASSFASFYENCSILKEEDPMVSRRRLALCDLTARELQLGLGILGIDVPERM